MLPRIDENGGAQGGRSRRRAVEKHFDSPRRVEDLDRDYRDRLFEPANGLFRGRKRVFRALDALALVHGETILSERAHQSTEVLFAESEVKPHLGRTLYPPNLVERREGIAPIVRRFEAEPLVEALPRAGELIGALRAFHILGARSAGHRDQPERDRKGGKQATLACHRTSVARSACDSNRAPRRGIGGCHGGLAARARRAPGARPPD
jgi:hypothetical protein